MHRQVNDSSVDIFRDFFAILHFSVNVLKSMAGKLCFTSSKFANSILSIQTQLLYQFCIKLREFARVAGTEADLLTLRRVMTLGDSCLPQTATNTLK